MLKFNDGVSFDTSGSLRIERRYDGLYVVGNNMLIPIADREEGLDLIKSMSKENEKE